MAKAKKTGTDPSADGGVDTAGITLTKEHFKMIESLTFSVKRIKLDQEALAEDIKAVASKLGIKPGEIKEMVNWLIQEQEKGGVIEAKEKKLEMIRQVLDLADQ